MYFMMDFTDYPSLGLALIVLPLMAAFIISFLPSFNQNDIKQLTVGLSLKIFYVSLYVFALFRSDWHSSQYIEYITLDKFNSLRFVIGFDGISILLILLTTLLTFLCLLASWDLKEFQKFAVFFLCMESFLIIVWSTLDIMIFYIFFESVLIPMFLIVGFWGSRERRIRAAYLFFIYTLLGSVFMLIGICTIISQAGTTDYLYVSNMFFDDNVSVWLWLAFFTSFATKIPMLPFHIWLPEAHVEAPTSGSVILAGILLKLGGYGFLRYSISLFPIASNLFAPFMYTIGIISILYASLTAIRQNDLKRIIAYASIAHMNLVVIGFFNFNQNAIDGAVLQMLSHGLVSSALFLCVGIIYDRYHTRLLKYYGGLALTLPVFSLFFLFFTLANVAFPGTSSFVGEFLILAGVFQNNSFVSFMGSFGIILSGVYSMWLYNRVTFGNTKQNIHFFVDVTFREFSILGVLALFTLWMGIYPETFLSPLRVASAQLLTSL